MTVDDQALDDTFAALADRTRRRIYRRLRHAPGMTTGALAEETRGMTRWAVMKHLRVLRDAGLVHTFHDGRRRRHYADGARLAGALEWLTEADGS